MIKGIYEEKKKKDPKHFIHFLDGDKGNIFAWMVDEKGVGHPHSTLFLINKETGVISLYSDIHPMFGFDLNKDGKLKVK